MDIACFADFIEIKQIVAVVIYAVTARCIHKNLWRYNYLEPLTLVVLGLEMVVTSKAL